MPTTRRSFADGESAGGRPDAPLALKSSTHVGLGRHSDLLPPIDTEAQLEDALSAPADATVEALARLEGGVLILGAGGKMGPSLARMVRRAFEDSGPSRRVIAVSRFSTNGLATKLRTHGVETIAGDLLDAGFVNSLPDMENVIYLAGTKFGTAADSAQTWASNAYLPGVVMNRFRTSRVLALSSGNVYGLTPINGSRGSVETDAPDPQGEYAMSVVGRERVFEHFSRINRTLTVIIRLNYATELRYGVLVDLAQKVFRSESIPLSMGYFNAIWQRDACNKIVSSLELAGVPPLVLNITGTDQLSCRSVCERFGELLNREVRFTGVEAETALLRDASRAADILDPPEMTFDDLSRMTAQCI
jgi:hypothetical protein